MNTAHYTDIIVTAKHLDGAQQQRLDRLLGQLFPTHSRERMKSLILAGQVCVDRQKCRRPAQAVVAAQTLSVNLTALPPQTAADDCPPENIKLDIIFEDDHIVVINKPPQQVVHPGHGNRHGTLQAGLLFRYPAAAALPRAGIVHRLDKDTSGLLVAAKTRAAQNHLIRQFKTRRIGRHYWALVCGTPPATGIINQPIDRHKHHPLKMAVRAQGKPAVTRFCVLRQWHNIALLECRIETGRTHQIRVHLSHNNTPILGDPLYGAKNRKANSSPTAPAATGADTPPPITRQMLHAQTLALIHPKSNQPRQYQAPPPPDMQTLITHLNKQNSTTAQ